MYSTSSKRSFVALAALATLSPAALAVDGPFTMCKESTCTKCPVQISSDGTGYPKCVVYNSADIFKHQGFKGTPGGGYQTWFNIAEPGPSCATIIKSPASTDVLGCGTTVGAFKHATCASIPIDTTFMVQFCCGTGDCKAAGADGPSKLMRGIDYRSAFGGSGSFTFLDGNGTQIEPYQVGFPPEERKTRDLADLVARGKCKKNSWKADPGKGDYTKPSPHTSIVLDDVEGGQGGAQVTITSTREQSWTTTMSVSIGIEDVLSLGLSFSESFTKTVSDSKSYQFSVPEGQSGEVGFTATLRCSTGTANCGGSTHGELCSPQKDSDGRIIGTYAVVATS